MAYLFNTVPEKRLGVEMQHSRGTTTFDGLP